MQRHGDRISTNNQQTPTINNQQPPIINNQQTPEQDGVMVLPNGDKLIPLPNGKFGLVKKQS